MSSVGMGVRRRPKNTDYDAAQALLDLQSNKKQETNSRPRGWRDLDSKEDIEKAAKLILSCFIASDDSSSKMERTTRDIGTQTEEQYLNPNIELMEITIKNLCDRIKNLESQIKINQSESVDHSENEASIEIEKHDLDISCEDDDHDPNFEMSLENDSNTSKTSYFDNSVYNNMCSRQTNQHVVFKRILTNNAGNSNDMVPIGDGHASVPSRLLKHINWNSYSSATRKLLTAVFTRRVLATHSLTGKPSPAFPNKPAKKRLDPALINDIVQTVVERCRVPENVVRTSITTKCADESKMFRTREKNKKRKSHKKNRENLPPTSDSDFDDY